MAIIARLIIGAHEPGEGIIEARLVDVEHRNGGAQTCGGAMVGLLQIRAARFVKALDLPGRIGNADFGELR